MSVTLTTFRGRLAVEIDDYRGQPQLYYPVRLPAGSTWAPGCWALRLERLDRDSGECLAFYRVRLWPDGVADCDCPHFRYRRLRCEEEGGCKHAKAAADLRRVLEAVFNEETDRERASEGAGGTVPA